MYTPRRQSDPKPCVLTLTPYIADSYHERGIYFASQGVPFVIVDVRGRGNSGGVFRPLLQEAEDGHDVVEWLARQPYCNGKVGMWGGSYAGYNQWAAAKELPPHLSTMAPVAAPYPGVDFPMRNNIFQTYLLQWLIHTRGRASQSEIFSDSRFWSAFYRRWHESGSSFRALAESLGTTSSLFLEWLSHPEPDAYWDAYSPRADQYAHMQIPILTITGSYDDNQPGALEHYRQYMSASCPEGRARHYLIIGPWDHAGTRTPLPELGGLQLGPTSVLDLNRLHVQWYAWTLQDGPKPEFLKKQVAYYVMGAEQWCYSDTLEAITDHHEAFFLDSSSHASDVFSSGSLGPLPGRGQPDSYTYDPRDIKGAEVEAEANASALSLVDQSTTLALRGKALVYHSAPFQQHTEVSGFFKLTAWIAIDCADTDLYVSVFEITSNGGSIRLSTDAIRARYREGLRSARLIGTTRPLRYDFERFTFVSRQIKRGHRLRLVIAPVGRLTESVFVQKNYNRGGVVAEESANDGKPVTVTLYHDGAYQSALYLPIGQSGSRGVQ